MPATATRTMKIIVFGASGEVGRRLVAEASGRGHRVTAVSRQEPGPGTHGPSVTTLIRDVESAGDLHDLIADHDLVISALRPRDGDEAKLIPLTAAVVPEGIDDAMVRQKLLNDFNIEISGGLGDLRGKVWRIGLMGESAREVNVFALLSALEIILSSQGYEVAYGTSLSAAQRALAGFDG